MLIPNINRVQLKNTLPPVPTLPYAFLTGTNVGGLNQADFQLPLVNGTNGKALVTSDINYLVSVGCTAVRYLISQELLQSNATAGNNIAFTDFNLANLTLVINNINALTTAGIYVLIGRHEGQDIQFGQFNSIALNGNTTTFPPGSVLADFWRRMVNVVGPTNAMVGYSLDNEPLLGSGPGGWWDVAKTCIKAIRRAGSSQLIACPGISYSASSTWQSIPWNDPNGGGIRNSVAFMTMIDDLTNELGITRDQLNVVAELHEYMSANDTGADGDVVSGTIGRQRLATVVQWSIANKQRYILGEWANEFSVTNGTANATDFNEFTKLNSPINNGYCIGQFWWAYASYPFTFARFSLTRVGAAYPAGSHSSCMAGLIGINFFAAPTAFNPTTSVPNIYARWQASDWNSGTGLIPDSSGLATDTTKDMEVLTSATNISYVAPDFNAADPDFNNQASIGSTSVTGGRTVGFRNRGNVNFATTVASGIATVYGVYFISSTPSPSSCYLRSNRSLGTGGSTTATLTPGAASLWYFGNYQATTNNTNNVGGATGGSAPNNFQQVRIICNVYNGGSSASYVSSNTALSTGNTGGSAITSMGMGNPGGQASLWRMGEVIMYSAVHSTADRIKVMNYLQNKYGIYVTP